MEYERRGPYLIVHVGKELDHHQARMLQDGIEKVRKEYGYKHMIFDFSNTTFMDSSGVGMIISQYKNLSMQGGAVCAVGIHAVIDKLFYVSGLHKIIRVYPELEDVFNGKK